MPTARCTDCGYWRRPGTTLKGRKYTCEICGYAHNKTAVSKVHNIARLEVGN